MQIGIGEPCQPPRFAGFRDQFGAGLGALVEINPPHRNAGDEGREECADSLDGPGQIGKGHAVDDDGFAEGNDDEAGATLGHVAAIDGPFLDRGPTIAGDPEAGRRGDVFDRQRYGPQHKPRLCLHEATKNPE